jgi:hypothetical protein
MRQCAFQVEALGTQAAGTSNKKSKVYKTVETLKEVRVSDSACIESFGTNPDKSV